MKARAALLLAGLCAAVTLLVPAVAANAYPPTTCSMLSVSTTNPQPGQEITVTGSHFKPDAHVALALDTRSDVLANVTTSVTGRFSTGVTLPTNKTGRHRLKAYGGNRSIPGCPATVSQALQFQAGGESSSTGGGGTGGSGGGTAFTGVDIAALLALALALITVGVLFNRRGAPKRAETR